MCVFVSVTIYSNKNILVSFIANLEYLFNIIV